MFHELITTADIFLIDQTYLVCSLY